MTLFEIHINNSSEILDFVSSALGVIVSAVIAWCVYHKQTIEKEVKSNIATFSYLLSLICKNFEELHNAKSQIIDPSLKEIDNFLNTLKRIELYMDWAIRGVESPINIEIPKENIDNYAKDCVGKLSKKLILSESTKQYFTYIDLTDFKKEAVLLSHFGDINFNSICNRLDMSYNIINNIKDTILLYNTECMDNPRKIYGQIKIINNDETYKEDIENIRNQVLYRQTLFIAYKKTVSRCLVYSYIAACHLESFFYHYLKKYSIVSKKLGVPYKSLELQDDTFLNDVELDECLQEISAEECKLFSIPLYKHLKRTVWDRLSDLIFYLKWQ